MLSLWPLDNHFWGNLLRVPTSHFLGTWVKILSFEPLFLLSNVRGTSYNSHLGNGCWIWLKGAENFRIRAWSFSLRNVWDYDARFWLETQSLAMFIGWGSYTWYGTHPVSVNGWSWNLFHNFVNLLHDLGRVHFPLCPLLPQVWDAKVRLIHL